MNNNISNNSNDDRIGAPPLPSRVPIPMETNNMFRSVMMATSAKDGLLESVPAFGSHHAKNQRVESHRVIGRGHREIVDPKKSRSDHGSEGEWRLPGGNLPQVPMFHPLDPTSLKLRGVSAQTIATRIANFMRMNSIACSYHASSEVASIDCLALEGMITFAVMLWRGRDEDASNDDEVIIVEFQRRQGCGFACQRLRNRLYTAVASGEDTLPGDDGIRKRAKHCDFLRNKQNLHNDDDTATTACSSIGGHMMDEDEMHFEAYDDCVEFLQSPYHDQNRLGLESLCILTDCEKTWSPELVAKTSKRLVFGEDSSSLSSQRKESAPHHYFHDSDVPRKSMGELLEPYFCDIELSQPVMLGNVNCHRLEDEDGWRAILDYEQGSEFGVMHLLALQSLSNALQSVASLPYNETQPCRERSKLWRTVSKALMYNMENATKRPTEAALSAQCARLLLQTKLIEPSAISGNVQDFVIRALEHGRAYHLLLESESEQLLAVLGEQQL